MSALDDLRKLRAQYGSLFEAAEKADKIASFEQATREAEKRLAVAREKHEGFLHKVEDERRTEQERVAAVYAEANKIHDANVETLRHRQYEVENIVPLATAQAEDIIAQAQATADKIVKDAREATARVQANLDALGEQIAAKRIEYNQLAAMVIHAEQRHAAILAKIAEAKAI
jgi:hypothetical protein